MADNTETFIIRLKDRGFGAGIDSAGNKTDRLRNKVEATKTSVGGLTRVFKGLLAAGLITKGIGSSITAFNKQEQALAQVRVGLQTTGGVANRTFDELTRLAVNLQKKTLFGDEEILQDATAQLLTFTSIAGDQFDRAQVSALNLATRLNQDLKSASLQLGKALNDPAKGMSALSRSGITFTNEQIKVVKHLQETNRLAEAQSLILDELEKQYGGSAEAAAAAGTGGMKQLGNVIGDVQEKLGALLYDAIEPMIPTLMVLADNVGRFFSFLSENKDTLGTIFAIIGGALAPITAITLAIKIWTAVQWLLNIALTANPIGIVVALIGALIAGIVVAWKKSDKFRAVLKALWASIKQVGENIKKNFLAIPQLVIKAFKAIPTAIKQIFSGTGKLLKAIFTGDFGAIGTILKENFANNALVNVGKDFVKDRIEDARKVAKAGADAYNEEMDRSAAEKAKKKAAEEEKANAKKFNNSNAGLGSGMPKGGKNGLGAGIAGVKASAPKTFNINIESLIKEQNISTTTLNESASKIKEAITKALLLAVNDSQVIAE